MVWATAIDFTGRIYLATQILCFHRGGRLYSSMDAIGMGIPIQHVGVHAYQNRGRNFGHRKYPVTQNEAQLMRMLSARWVGAYSSYGNAKRQLRDVMSFEKSSYIS
jgi:hypothetical protein